jgi:hypothetical protein
MPRTSNWTRRARNPRREPARARHRLWHEANAFAAPPTDLDAFRADQMIARRRRRRSAAPTRAPRLSATASTAVIRSNGNGWIKPRLVGVECLKLWQT